MPFRRLNFVTAQALVLPLWGSNVFVVNTVWVLPRWRPQSTERLWGQKKSIDHLTEVTQTLLRGPCCTMLRYYSLLFTRTLRGGILLEWVHTSCVQSTITHHAVCVVNIAGHELASSLMRCDSHDADGSTRMRAPFHLLIFCATSAMLGLCGR